LKNNNYPEKPMSPLKKLTIAASIAGLAACGADDDGDAYVRILHASPDAQAVDVYVNGELQLSDVAFQDGTGYLKLSDGNANIELRLVGTDTVAASYAASLNSNAYYAAIAVNQASELDITVLDETDVVTDGDIDLRVLHAAPAASSTDVDVFVSEPDAELGATPQVNALSYLSNQLIEGVEDGSYQIRVTADGSSDVIYDSGSIRVRDDAIVVAVNSEQGRSPVSLLVWSGPAATTVLDNTSELRIVHAVDTIDVDVYTSGELYREDLSYTDVSEYIVFPAGELPITITAADAALEDAPSGLSTSLDLTKGESYTLVASGSSDDLDNATFIFLTDQREPEDESAAYLRYVHASTDNTVANSDLFIYSGGSYVEPDDDTENPDFKRTGFSRGDESGYVERAAATTYEVDVTATNTTAPDLVSGLGPVTPAAGDIKTTVIIGKSGPVALELSPDNRAD
jgi:FlaG/FlaF family flagellin (archaellin)